ncbi:MAG TPA: glycosyltransferase [Verrucomicrobiae bacterium]|jgi:glycosyltransferase involved in cell wall biosynthesis|nr:glycosyltransferase [Verrucomicrobiae bacterium]
MKSQPHSVHAPLVAVFVISDLEFGGLQRQIVNVANYMDDNLCQIYLCSLADCVPLSAVLRDKEKRLKLILRRGKYDFTVVPRLARFLREVQADIVYNNLFDATIAGRLSGRWAGRPAIVDSEANTDYKLKFSNAVALRLTRWCNDVTIANSRAGAAYQSRLLGQSPETYRVVYNGVDVERFKPGNSSALRAELGLKESQPVVGMFASFKPQKNHPLWLRAAKKVVERIPDVKLVFVGDELFKGGSNSLEFKKTISKTVDDLGLRPHCLFLGNKSDVENYYNICTLTVLPSLYEGMPNVALESMACGVPIVATNVADNAHLIRDGQTGFVIPLGDDQILADRVCQLLLDPSLRQRMSQEGRRWMAGEFSCRKFADKTLAVFREAIVLRTTGRLIPQREGLVSLTKQQGEQPALR